MHGKVVGAAFAAAMLVAVAACSDTTSTPTEPTPTASAGAPSAASSPSGQDSPPSGTSSSQPSQDASARNDQPAAGSAVEQYCRDVDQLIADYRKALTDPTQGNAAKLAEQTQELATRAADLVDELINDPAAAEKARSCTSELENLNNPEGGG